MLHRFTSPEMGIKGHDPRVLRHVLGKLRHERYQLQPLDTVIEDLAEGRTHARPSVAFTIDDGYLDQATVAAPIFAEFDCPVTTFVTTGFLDGKVWFWWDRIEYVFQHATRQSIAVPIDGSIVHYDLRTDIERDAAYRDFTAHCKEVADAAKCEAITLLAKSAEVDVPEVPPPRYAPMSWDDLRRCETMTMRFGPHSVTHPILSRMSDDASRHEVTESWNRLKAEAKNPLPIFCYPNGRPGDFTEREMCVLAELGALGAVTVAIGYACAAQMRGDDLERFRIRRFAYPDSVDDFMMLVSGAERLKQILRGES